MSLVINTLFFYDTSITIIATVATVATIAVVVKVIVIVVAARPLDKMKYIP